MNNDFIELLPNDNPMIYYLLPSVIKRRCRALKNISLEQERLEMKHKQLRRRVCSKYSCKDEISHQQLDHDNYDDDSQRTFTCPFDMQSLRLLARKADDLRAFITSQTASNTARACATNFNSKSIRSFLDGCEAKCHELLTQLANIDWELYEFEESLTLYNADIEEAMTEYNMELTALYKRRLGIIQGDHEPTDEECYLPNYLNRSNPPKYLKTERSLERLFTMRYCSDAELMVGHHRIKGVPEFWFQSILIALKQVGVIEIPDYEPLKYLVDVRYYYDTERHDDCNDDGHDDELLMNSDHRTQVLLFYFDKNPHFSNRILSKTLHIDRSGRSGRQMFDGLWVNKIEGCTINWLQGHDLTTGVTIARTSNNRTQHEMDEIDYIDEAHLQLRRSISLAPRTFFNFFGVNGLNYSRRRTVTTRGHIEGGGEGTDEGRAQVEIDYDVFVKFRDFIVPHAIVAYSRGNLFGFECEHCEDGGESLPQKMHYLNTLFDSPGD